MIISELKTYKNNIPYKVQFIIVKCDECDKSYNIGYIAQLKGISIYKKDLCKGCKQKEQIKMGVRGKQYINAGKSASNRCKGKTLEEIYGLEKALSLKSKFSDNSKGENNPNYGGTWYGKNPAEYQKGKTYEELYGKEKSDNIKKKLSLKSKGENNNMFGKPSPSGSGNGWSGWYKGWFFRSLKELSFMINTIERFNFKWESAEIKKYKIKYIDYDGSTKNYFSDFILNDKYMVEIKPKYLHNTMTNLSKKKYAIEYCNNNGLIYKVIDPVKISYNVIKELVDNGDIIFLDRYKEKFKNYKN